MTSTGKPAAFHPPGRTPLAARHQVRRLLRLGRGRGSAVLVVSGGPGAGRTTLLDATARRGSAEGFRVLRVGLAPSSAGRPYGAVSDLLAPLVADGPLTGRSRLTRRLDRLERLYGGPTRRPPAPLPDRAAEQEQLFIDVRRLLRRACVREPVLLVVDDLQWADPSSLALLRQVVVQPAGLPLRVIVSVASGGSSRPGADPFRALPPTEERPLPQVDRLQLRRTRPLAAPAEEAQRVLGGLDDGATEVLQLIGVAGGRLEQDLLGALCPPGRAGPGLAALLSAGLVEVDHARPPAYRARSWTLAQAAYDRLPRANRRDLHLRVLRASGSLAPEETSTPAYQAVRAGTLLDPDERLALLARHALTASERYAEWTAVVAADAALLAAEEASEPARRSVGARLLDLRAESLAATGRPTEAIESWTAAATLALTGPSTSAAHRLRRLAETSWTSGCREEAVALADRAAGALPDGPPDVEHLAVHALRARIRSQLATGDFVDVVAPLAELWRRTGWHGAEAEYKLALEALRPEAARSWRHRSEPQPSTVSAASTTIAAPDAQATTS